MRTKVLAFCIALASTCAMVHRGSAQDVQLYVDALDVQARKQIPTSAERQRVGFQRYLAVRVDQLKRVCQLSDEQVKTLQVAAKGAVRQSMDKWQKQVKQRQSQLLVAQLGGGQFFFGAADVPFQLNGGADVEEVGAAEEQEALDGHDHADPVPPLMPAVALDGERVSWVLNHSANFSSVANERVWTKSVQRVLTGPQQKAYRETVAERRAFNRSTAINQLVAKIDEHLLLSSSQRRKMVRIVDEVMTGKMAERRRAGLPNREVQGMDMVQIVRLFPQAKVEAVLSTAQRARWDDFKSDATAEPPSVIFSLPRGKLGIDRLRNNILNENAE